MRIPLGLLILGTLVPLCAMAQVKAVPPWPELNSSTCAAIAPPINPAQLTWKPSEEERADVSAIGKMEGDKRGAALEAVAEKYPDSRGAALLAALIAYGASNDVAGQVRIAKALIDLPTAQAGTRIAAYATLTGNLSATLFPADPDKARKLADLENWTECGMAALPAQIRPDNMQPDQFEKNRQMSESIFYRTRGFVAFQREDYLAAVMTLETARQLNPEDALTSLWLGCAKLLSPDPDLNSGVFYLARNVALAPQVSPDLLKKVYGIIHGSEKDLDKVEATAKVNAAPPPGFSVMPPPKKEHNYGATIATAAIIGLLVYGDVKLAQSPGGGAVAGSIAETFAPAVPSKLMIFGGPDHRTYLGCLSCSESAPDSVFNQYGRNGSRYQVESIWNNFGQYGSPYYQFSACNQSATDPPIMVDENGNAYGRLTVNKYVPGFGMGAQFYGWLVSTVCSN